MGSCGMLSRVPAFSILLFPANAFIASTWKPTVWVTTKFTISNWIFESGPGWLVHKLSYANTKQCDHIVSQLSEWGVVLWVFLGCMATQFCAILWNSSVLPHLLQFWFKCVRCHVFGRNDRSKMPERYLSNVDLFTETQLCPCRAPSGYVAQYIGYKALKKQLSLITALVQDDTSTDRLTSLKLLFQRQLDSDISKMLGFYVTTKDELLDTMHVLQTEHTAVALDVLNVRSPPRPMSPA